MGFAAVSFREQDRLLLTPKAFIPVSGDMGKAHLPGWTPGDVRGEAESPQVLYRGLVVRQSLAEEPD